MTYHTSTLYCFVDETGQETEGRFFLVSVVIADQEYGQMAMALEEIEHASKKSIGKWRKTTFEIRIAYLEAVLKNPLFVDTIYFAQYAGSQDYLDLTVQTTANAIRCRTVSDDYIATITVDGLKGKEVDKFKRRLRMLNISVRKVRGARDESDPMIRLADAFAGFIRDYLEGQTYAQQMFERAVNAGVVREL